MGLREDIEVEETKERELKKKKNQIKSKLETTLFYGKAVTAVWLAQL